MRHGRRKPHGVIMQGGREVADTLQCPHCAKHFAVDTDLHKKPYCANCNDFTCGKKKCMKCFHFRKRHEQLSG